MTDLVTELAAAGDAEDIKSPCIRQCCLDDNDVCMGCYRTMAEILSWAASSQEEKKAVIGRCQSRRTSQ